MSVQENSSSQGVPLIAYATHAPETRVEVACCACLLTIAYSPIEMIQRLLKSGRGDGNSGVHTLAERIRGPCRRCGGRQFSAVLHFRDPVAVQRTGSYPRR